MHPLLRLALVPAAVVLTAAGAWTIHYTVAPESQFWIDGTSTMGAFTCEADGVEGSAAVTGEGAALGTADLTVPVSAFDCPQRRMTRDLHGALRGDAHPTIRFMVDRADLLGAESRPGAWVPAQATGRLMLAGVERPVVIGAEGRRLPGGRVRVRGEHALLMTDFGVDPPSGMMGLVRAHDRVVARFDLVASPSSR